MGLSQRERRGRWRTALASLLAALPLAADAAKVLLVNHSPDPVEVDKPKRKSVDPGKSWGATFTGTLRLGQPQFTTTVLDERYWVVAVDASGGVAAYNTNDLQMEFSSAAYKCQDKREAGEDRWMRCLASLTFGGIPLEFSREAFAALWESYQYWQLCEASEPSPALRTLKTKAVGTVEVLRESPLVVTVRGFLNEQQCEVLMEMAGFDQLTRAHTGAGGGRTATSESRETLTRNLFVNWDMQDELTEASARMFDVASELLGDRVPYEGQEPVNFLHYLKGYEYKPHMDGSAERLGKRVATTLSYCQAASSGGATVFPSASPKDSLKFSPGPGDLLFFQYSPNPRAALHAACPVGLGNKTTLTQWHRLGVSAEKPWDNFEDWGKFHNPYASSRYRGPRQQTTSAGRAEI